MTRRNAMGIIAAAAASPATAQRVPANVGLHAATGPARSECGVGALLPWADSLWAVTYNSHTARTGRGLSLWRIDDELRAHREHDHDGTHANRYVHSASNQAIIGPYAIDLTGKWRFIERFRDERLTATMTHLTAPKERVYMLTMEGLLYEMDVADLKVNLVADLNKQFGIKRPHFKGGVTAQGRVVVSNNGFYEFGENEAGLFEWDGKTWNAVSRKPHMDCAARNNLGQVLFATGWDEMSVLFWALVKGKWQRYRLPKASHTFDHAWQTEWTRVREVETERFLMDIHGMFYDLQPLAFQDAIWGVKPICHHLRIVPDYCAFRGLLALGGNQTSPNADNNPVGGQPQSGIWFGKTDDLWQWGKPSGWGGVWRRTAVEPGQASDAFLMTSFDGKILHVVTDKRATVNVEVDFLGTGEWHVYGQSAGAGYRHFAFERGFSAHWVRLVAQDRCAATAQFMYT
jgi:hypothetical protein